MVQEKNIVRITLTRSDATTTAKTPCRERSQKNRHQSSGVLSRTPSKTTISKESAVLAALPGIARSWETSISSLPFWLANTMTDSDLHPLLRNLPTTSLPCHYTHCGKPKKRWKLTFPFQEGHEFAELAFWYTR